MVEENTRVDGGWLALHVGEGKYLVGRSSIFNLDFYLVTSYMYEVSFALRVIMCLVAAGGRSSISSSSDSG